MPVGPISSDQNAAVPYSDLKIKTGKFSNKLSPTDRKDMFCH